MDRLMEQRRSFGEAAEPKKLRTSRFVVKLLLPKIKLAPRCTDIQQ